MKKILINSPILSRSGYGEMARFALQSLRQHEDKFDIYLNVINWGQTGFIFEETEEYQYITALRFKTEQYIKQTNGQPLFDISLQITIPNEWKKMAPVNIGYTAGIETTHMSPAWFEPSRLMDKIITISEHAKYVFETTAFQDQNGNVHKVTTPVEVVHFPWKQVDDAAIDLNLPYDFNFLTVNQWGPRKNIEGLISAFIDEFREEEVGLVVKTNRASDSIMDKLSVEKQMQDFVASKGPKKCKIHLVHGCLTEKEMHGLYRHPKIKAFVTATHGEGFGLPIFEAVNEEMPVIATNWSGHLDFLNGLDKEGQLKPMFAKIDFEIKPIQEQFVWPGVMEKGSGWAFPEVSSIRTRMREVYKDYPRFKSWGKKVSTYNKEKFDKKKIFAAFNKIFVKEKPQKKISKITGLSFCIPTNSKKVEITKKLIKSIKKQNWNDVPYEIILCGKIEDFKNLNNVKLINKTFEAENRKVAVLRNEAALNASYDTIVFCDDDIILSDTWFEDTVAYSKKNAWNVLSNKILSPDGTRYWDRAILNPHIMVDYDHTEEDSNLYQTSCFFMIKKEVFKKVKWDETKLVYADREGGIPEDVQYSLDLNKHGYTLSFNKNATVWHSDSSYTEYVANNIAVCLKKDMISTQTGRDYFLDVCEEYNNNIEAYDA